MLEHIRRRKNELKHKSELYSAAWKKEYSQLFVDPMTLYRIGLLSIGTLIALYLLKNYHKTNSVSELIKEDTWKSKAENAEPSDDRGIINEFKNKIIIIALELIRQFLIMIIGKIRPANEKKGL